MVRWAERGVQALSLQESDRWRQEPVIFPDGAQPPRPHLSLIVATCRPADARWIQVFAGIWRVDNVSRGSANFRPKLYSCLQFVTLIKDCESSYQNPSCRISATHKKKIEFEDRRQTYIYIHIVFPLQLKKKVNNPNECKFQKLHLMSMNFLKFSSRMRTEAIFARYYSFSIETRTKINFDYS